MVGFQMHSLGPETYWLTDFTQPGGFHPKRRTLAPHLAGCLYRVDES